MTRILAASILLLVPVLAYAEEAEKPRPAIYDKTANAKEQVKAATALAHRDARRVLVMFGFNGCGW